MPQGYSLTAVVLSCNAQDKIGNCLRSLKWWANEVVVVDGQSQDETIKIARQFGALVHSHVFLGSFAEERNFGADKASGEWVLQLDSDEVVTDEFKKQCDAVLPLTTCAAFKFKRKNSFLGHTFTRGGWYHWSQHLYKKGFARYEGRVHETMHVDGEVGLIEADILHFPFDNLADFVQRQNRYTDLQAQDIIDSEKHLDDKLIRYNLTWKPLKLFKKMYFDKKGRKEGMHGLVFSILFAWVHFLKWAKVWERRLK